MSLSVAIPVIVAADVAIVALLAFVMSRAALLTPHRDTNAIAEPALAPSAGERSERRATQRAIVPAARQRSAAPQPVRS